MDLMVKYLIFVLQVCAIASSLFLEGSSAQTISPSASVPPIIEGPVTNNSPGPTSQPNDPPHFESPNEPPPNAGVAGPITSIPEETPPSPQVVPPTTPVSVPPIPQPQKGPDSKSPVSPPTASVQIAPPPPPKDVLQNPPPVEAPPIIFPGPVASPPNKLPMASPPPSPTLPVPPPNLPLPVELPPSTLPSSPPTLPPPPPNLPVPVDLPPSSPPTLPPPPPNLPAPSVSPPSILPINPPPSPPTSATPPPNLPAPVASPPSTLPVNPPPNPPTSATPPPNVPVPMASPPSTLPVNPPPSPPTSATPPPNLPAPMASPPSTLPINPPPSPPTSTIPPPVPVASPPHASQINLSPPPPSFVQPPSNLPGPVALPPRNSPENLPPVNHNSSAPPTDLPVSPISPPTPTFPPPPSRTTNIAPPPHSPVKAPIVHHAPPPYSSHEPPPTKSHPPPSLPPSYPPPPGPESRPTHHRPPPPPGPAANPSHRTPPPPNLDSAVPPMENSISPSISPFPSSPPPVQTTKPVFSPKVSPSQSPPRIPKPIQALPPPPPNEDCSSVICMEPLTNTPPGTPCKCVLPMQVELRLTVTLYTFFPLVSELAFEMASGLFMRSSQVRIMGANEDSQDQEKTIVIINLVPLGEKFDNFTAYVAAQRLWLKQVPIKTSLFGDYEVLFVKYPGLPPSPPMPSPGYNGEGYGHGNNGRDVKPLGVDVSKQRHSNKLNSGLIAIIAFSVVVAVVLVGVVVWVLVFKDRTAARSGSNPPATLPSLTKSSGAGASMAGSGGPELASLSFRSSIAYTGSAKTFSSSDMEKATDNFNESGVLGEGGFGRVYNGVLEDGTKVAVKVLKRDDQQGGREFLAEVEMLSRLHHRNLVRLLGICTEEKNRCLVYELIPNGSVESHLHGIDKETSPLDWGARLKIALGAARGLAYLHEDSSPRVIHRDFKSSNILLEHDFTPKVSDFGLARTALDEDNRHISTRVMGTFGYVAPEYAMTGHLLVKSDVYSYGVVLLELLTGRKPVDMSMPPGQENLVAWARPLLPTPEGLNLLIDPSLPPETPPDSIAKVAAIASMCVQPEVSHRPFMGEVVQALKLVCNECEETQDLGSRSCSHEDLTSMEFDPRAGSNSGLARGSNYTGRDSSPLDVESGFSGLGLGVDSYRISSSSGPLRPRRRLQLWERMKRFSSGSMSDYGEVLRLLSRSR